MKAFTAANEEQGCKTTHRHRQIGIKEMSQTLRNSLFGKNSKRKLKERKKFCKFIDKVICASYGDKVRITHRCDDEKNMQIMKNDIPKNLFKERESDIFQQARNKDSSDKVKGGIMFCEDCDKTISTVDIVNQSLQTWRDSVISGERAQYIRPDTKIPLSAERLDMAAYTFSYHMGEGCALETDSFGGNIHVQETLLKYRFKEHSSWHCASCFKKDCKC